VRHVSQIRHFLVYQRASPAPGDRELPSHLKPGRDFKMPTDMLSYALVSMVCQEEHSRSDEVAAKLLEIMAAPNEIMDERTKLFGMLHVLPGF
jgi:hypothetical protein